ncbi:hypothetical protein BDZ94DRAFT_1177577 [Collybia nuda]|uniref:Uncharacterized protein n=1 Tax=Collybia nuda TaxID=64659 RepID=A0A9P5XVZ1_9AGAR|nr:hypothetical protein BDZ94DRAFT_1177577 [Collybia nuda]
MLNSLKVLRYLIFGALVRETPYWYRITSTFITGIFIICNAIVASVAVWNHSLAELTGRTSGEIDLYLIFLGCFGLALIFTIIFVELACKNPVTGRVWFECTWVGLFWTLYLAGATAMSIVTPGEITPPNLSLVNDSCTSMRVIIAFSWVNTIILLSYFLFLVIASLVHLKHDSRIWHRYVYKFPWSDFRRSISSAPVVPVPASPSLPQFLKKMPSIVAPKPRQAAPKALYNYRSGLSLEYEIEHYRPPSHHSPKPSINFPVLPVPSAAHPFDPARMTRQPTDIPSSSFYPQYMQSALVPAPQQRDSCAPQHPVRPPSPLPLGDWPRPNAAMQPLRSKRDKLPLSSNSPSPTSEEKRPKTTLRPRPSGPRRKIGVPGGSQPMVQDSGSPDSS